jgi:hypothetical protein
MALILPAALEKLMGMFGPFPEMNEDKLREAGDEYETVSGYFSGLSDAFSGLIVEIRNNFQGQSADAFTATMRDFVDGADYLGSARDGALQLAQFARDTANEVEYAKWMSLAMLIQLLAELAFYAATSWFNPAAEEEAAAAEAVTGVVIRSVLTKLLKAIVTHVALSAGMGVAMDVLIQLIQKLQGHRTSWSTSTTIQTLEFGAVGGAVGLGLGPLGEKLGSLLGNMLGKDLGEGLGNEFEHLLSEPFTAVTQDGAKEFGNGLGQVFGENADSLVSGFGKGVKASDVRDVGDDPDFERAADIATLTQSMIDFGKDVADVFEQNLGDRLGADVARGIGGDFGATFAGTWGRRGAGLTQVKEALAASLAPHAEVLGADGVRALSEQVPDAIVRVLAEKGGPDVGRMAAQVITAAAESGATMTLSQGIYGLIFDPSHTFTVSGETFGMGAAMGAAGRSGHVLVDAAKELRAPKIELPPDDQASLADLSRIPTEGGAPNEPARTEPGAAEPGVAEPVGTLVGGGAETDLGAGRPATVATTGDVTETAVPHEETPTVATPTTATVGRGEGKTSGTDTEPIEQPATVNTQGTSRSARDDQRDEQQDEQQDDPQDEQAPPPPVRTASATAGGSSPSHGTSGGAAPRAPKSTRPPAPAHRATADPHIEDPRVEDPRVEDPRVDDPRWTAARDAVTPVSRAHTWVDPVSKAVDELGRPTQYVVHSDFDVRRFEFDGERVTDLTVAVRFERPSPVGEEHLDTLLDNARRGVEEHLNAPRYRLPNGDRLNVTVERTDDPDAAHLTVEVVGGEAAMTQRAWRVDAEPVDLAHEISHQLGLRDEYRDETAPHRPEVVGTLAGGYGRHPGETALRDRHLQLIGRLADDVPFAHTAPRAADRPATVRRGGAARSASARGAAPKSSRKSKKLDTRSVIDQIVGRWPEGEEEKEPTKAYGGGQRGRGSDNLRLRFARDKQNERGGQTLSHLSMMLHDTIRALGAAAGGTPPRDREVQGMLINGRLVFASNHDTSIDLLENAGAADLHTLLDTRQTPEARRGANMGNADFAEYNGRMERAAAKVQAAYNSHHGNINPTAHAMRQNGIIRFEHIDGNGARLRALLTEPQYRGSVLMLRHRKAGDRSMHSELKLLLAMKEAGVQSRDVTGPHIVMGKFRPCAGCSVALSWHQENVFTGMHFNPNYGMRFQDSIDTVNQHMPYVGADARVAGLFDGSGPLMSAAAPSRQNRLPGSTFNNGWEKVIPTSDSPANGGYVTASDSETETVVDRGNRVYLSKKRALEQFAAPPARMGVGHTDVSRPVTRVLSEADRWALRGAWNRVDPQGVARLLSRLGDTVNKTELAEVLGTTWQTVDRAYQAVQAGALPRFHRRAVVTHFDSGAERQIEQALHRTPFGATWNRNATRPANTRESVDLRKMPEALGRVLQNLRTEHSLDSIAAHLDVDAEALRTHLDTLYGPAFPADADVKMEDVEPNLQRFGDGPPRTYFDENLRRHVPIPFDNAPPPQQQSFGAGSSTGVGTAAHQAGGSSFPVRQPSQSNATPQYPQPRFQPYPPPRTAGPPPGYPGQQGHPGQHGYQGQQRYPGNPPPGPYRRPDVKREQDDEDDDRPSWDKGKRRDNG